MATTLSSIIRFQASSQAALVQPGTLVTPVTQRRPPSRQVTPPVLLSLPREPEDARITGGTRSLARRLLALNLSGVHSTPNAA
jgi:hypothetical protein